MSVFAWIHDPIYETERPLRLFDQNFGMGFDDEDFFPWRMPIRRPNAYYWLRSRQVPERTAYEKQLQKSGVSELNVAKDNFTVSQLKQLGAQFKLKQK
jgi:Alpha crystallin A chain, N terminal